METHSDSSVASIHSAEDIVHIRCTARYMAASVGFSLADQTRLATAVSELTRNVILYAGEGSCTITDFSSDTLRRIRVTVTDFGPGIANLAEAMSDGFSTGGGLGAGLPGSRRLVDTFNIQSRPGFTEVVIEISKPRIGG